MSERIDLWRRVAEATNGSDYARRYAQRFAELEAEGNDVHGEVAFLQLLRPAPASVLDAGCGTGRIAARLSQLGYSVVGCDADGAMVEVAREHHPDLDWRVADLATFRFDGRFDLVVLAGNVIPFVPVEDLDAVAESLAAHTAPGGLVVAGYGTDTDHLPDGVTPPDPSAFEDAMERAGFGTCERWADWNGATYDPAGGYVVAAWTAEVTR